ncbi:MAG: DUF2520 domain-containing protein [Bacteroidetes bacterium]|nr:DUF2520 domain-containing protein [Bacteroidota bacterium]
MTYALFGTGNMAWLLATRMTAAGHICVGAWGRNAEAMNALCDAYYLPRLAAPEQLNDGPDAVILALSDDAIPSLISRLSLRYSTLIHTAGSVPLSLLEGHSNHIGVVWPVYSIRKDSLPAHRSFAALIEANTPVAKIAVREVAKAICDQQYEAGSEQRAWMHVAAVMGNNFVNHLLGIAASISATQEVPLSILQPLLEQPLQDMRTKQPFEVQTGPARRHDSASMQRQLDMLATKPEWQELYRAASASIMKLYKPIGKPAS